MNYEIFTVINGLAGGSAVLDGFMIFAAKYLIYLFFVAAAVVTGLRARQDGWWPVGAWRIAQVCATLAIGYAFAVVVRMFGLSLRPFQSHHVTQLITHDGGVSLPSDHATASVAVAIAVWFFVSREWGPYFLGVAALIAVARVFVGVHYPADVTAGALLATIAGLLVWAATLLLRERMVLPAQEWDEDQLTDDRALESTR